ncbi:MAG: hypothetical protein K0S33_3607 [Bacteroidetes bacterium]|jgi:hypothetical protein|nr:hypothetical protein [Bacteroidota bacterium]
MLKHFSKISWLGVFLSLVFFSFFGWLYFTVVFPDQYATSLDKLGKMAAKPDPIYFYGPPLTILPTLIVTALLMVALNTSTLKAALELGLIVGLGYLVANTFDIAINPNIPHPGPYGVLVGGFQMIGILVSCSIMWKFRKK